MDATTEQLSTEQPPLADFSAITTDIRTYGGAVTLFIGVPANVSTLFILKGAYFRKTCASLLLIAMTVSDAAVLVMSSLRWLLSEVAQTDITEVSIAGCMVFHHLQNTFRALSAWALLTMIFERTVAIHFIPLGLKPIKKKYLRISILTVTSLLVILNTPWYWHINKLSTEAGFQCPMYDLTGIAPGWWWFHATVTDLLPLLLSLIVTCILSAKLGLAFASRRAVIHSAGTNNFSNFEGQVTSLSLALSYFYLFSVLPYVIVYIGIGHWGISEADEDLARHLTTLLLLLFYSCKLPLYFMVGSYKTWMKSSLKREAGEKARSIRVRSKNIEDSDQMTSKGLSHSAHDSLNGKDERLEEMLNHLEQMGNSLNSVSVDIPDHVLLEKVKERENQSHKRRISSSRRKRKLRSDRAIDDGDGCIDTVPKKADEGQIKETQDVAQETVQVTEEQKEECVPEKY